jgi:dTMP kinase
MIRLSQVVRFIALEGIDGSGTTTQKARLAAALRDRGLDVLETFEPSEGPLGTMARGMLRGDDPAAPDLLALVFAADRLEHLSRCIEPALAAGRTVICDRYVLSSLVYQSGVDPEPQRTGANS